jgi:hypothetical protein
MTGICQQILIGVLVGAGSVGSVVEEQSRLVVGSRTSEPQ